MKIINKLFDSGEIRRVVITMYGNDLLDQWAIQIRENYKNKQINYHYASQKMMKDFVMHPDDSVLILSRDARNLSKLLDLFDYDDGDFAMSISDNMAMDSDGDLMLRMGDHMAMDMDTGDIHMISSWPDDDE